MLKPERKSRNDEFKTTQSTMPHVIKVSPTDTKCQPDTTTVCTVASDKRTEKLMKIIRKWILDIPPTQIIDFAAVWIYFVLFLGFNYIYWNKYSE